MFNWTVFFVGLFAISLVGCTAIPPLDNPDISFGRKCQEDGSWSYVWIHDHDAGLTANKENCK